MNGSALAALLRALGVDEARLFGVARTSKIPLLSKAYTASLARKQAFVAAWPRPSTHPGLFELPAGPVGEPAGHGAAPAPPQVELAAANSLLHMVSTYRLHAC